MNSDYLSTTCRTLTTRQGGRARLPEGILGVGNSVCDMGAVQIYVGFFVAPQVLEDRPSNYLHGRLLFQHRWVGCLMSAV